VTDGFAPIGGAPLGSLPAPIPPPIPTPPSVDAYLALITAYHAPRPKFMASVQAVVAPVVANYSVVTGIPAAYDLDSAIGAQLDVLGLWIGRSRQVDTPLGNVYFSLDTPGLGADEGYWIGPFDPFEGMTNLADEPYRLLLRAKIAANNWDGTLAGAAAVYNLVAVSAGVSMYVTDNQDMTMDVAIAGTLPDPVIRALLLGGYLPLKPLGVRVNYLLTSTDGTPIFGFDTENALIAGLDVGSIAISA
jgi:Protein of unknown function (DUF2612)